MILDFILQGFQAEMSKIAKPIPDKLKDGMSDKQLDSKYNRSQLKSGIEVETENQAKREGEYVG